MSSLGFCLRGGLDRSEHVGDSSGLGLQHSLGLEFILVRRGYGPGGNDRKTYIIDDTGADPHAGKGCRKNNSAQLSLSDKVRLSLLQRLSLEISFSGGPGLDIGLCHGLSGSESVLQSFGSVDDLGGHPHASGWPDFDRSEDLSAGNVLDACH